jgi:Secretion system C-terminal sorting domain
MKKRFFYPLLVLFFFPLFVFAQNEFVLPCQLSPEAEASITARLINNKKLLDTYAFTRSLVTYVPVRIHLVADDDGTNRVSEGRALDMLCILNEEFEEADIQFYLKDGFSYVDNSILNNHTGFDTNPIPVWNEAAPYKSDQAINIFVAKHVDEPDPGAGTTLAYYSPYNDCIFINKGVVYSRSVLPHEMGHFFGLLHPFLGFEDGPFCEGQLNVDSPGCVNGIIENQSGSNCETAGDMICDTPPDYFFGFCSSECVFDGLVFDCEGNQVFTMENNMMSFFSNCADYEFTQTQKDLMLIDLFSPERDYVNPGITPNLEFITGQPEIVGPDPGDVLPYNALYFSWDSIAGATHYFLEIDEFSNFGENAYRVIVDTTEAFVVNWGEPTTNYYWHVRGFNEYRTCTFYSDISTFQTGNFTSDVKQITAIQNWSVQPNPLDENTLLLVSVSATTAFAGQLRIQSVSGKSLLEKEVSIAAGSNILEIPTIDLPKGVYFVSIQNVEGLMTKKLVIR